MNAEQILGYLAASFIIVVIPGPNILLIVHDSLTHGFRKSALTVLGITTGMAFLFSLSLAGITTLLLLFSWLLGLIKWVGVGYLVYLGISQIVTSFEQGPRIDGPVPHKSNFFSKGFLISATNPKGLVFAGAFFPQFLHAGGHMISQIIVLCGGFLVISLVIGILYALCCDAVRHWFSSRRFKVLTNRICGGLLILFGIGLAFAREDR
jgi:threonine/homoserine/homoserine lactone efflux protein